MKILIIRLSAIGDIFFCTALLDALKRHFPGCKVSWLTEPVGAQILQGHPQLDSLLVLPRKNWVKQFKRGHWVGLGKDLCRFLRTLRKEPYDLVIDPQGIFKSAIWARLALGEERIGVNGRDGSAFLYDAVVRIPRLKEPPILLDYRLLMAGLGGNDENLQMSLQIDASPQREAREWLGDSAPPVVFCPFTTRPQKHWPDTHWTELANRIEAGGMGPVLILGGPGDGERAEKIAKGIRSTPLISAGLNRSIPFALALLEEARAVIGVDTGLTHAGIALCKPTLALFGSTRPYAQTGSAIAKVLYTDLACAPCRRHPTCDGRFDCMRQLTPGQVCAELSGLLNVSD